MIVQHRFAIFLGISILLGLVAIGRVRSSLSGSPTEAKASFELSHPPQNENLSQEQQHRLILELSNPSADVESVKELVRLAKRSANDREVIVRELISDVNSHDELDGSHPILSNSFTYWIRVNQIFEELRAVEALDVMIRCIHCGNEMTGSLSVRPAFTALESLGSAAVPKLSDALRTNPNPYARSQIALCLGDIGGAGAKKGLEQALRSEKEREVIHNIKWGLATIAGDPSKYWH
jgi:hypothetical protein